MFTMSEAQAIQKDDVFWGLCFATNNQAHKLRVDADPNDSEVVGGNYQKRNLTLYDFETTQTIFVYVGEILSHMTVAQMGL